VHAGSEEIAKQDLRADPVCRIKTLKTDPPYWTIHAEYFKQGIRYSALMNLLA